MRAAAGSEFEPIYAQVRAIPKGRVLSYGDVAAMVGATARTVGWAMSAAPADVPWQRVVGADGYLRIRRRSPEMGRVQAELLAAEGVAVSESGYVDRRFFWDGETADS